jgi:hypothetical protein
VLALNSIRAPSLPIFLKKNCIVNQKRGEKESLREEREDNEME